MHFVSWSFGGLAREGRKGKGRGGKGRDGKEEKKKGKLELRPIFERLESEANFPISAMAEYSSHVIDQGLESGLTS